MWIVCGLVFVCFVVIMVIAVSHACVGSCFLEVNVVSFCMMMVIPFSASLGSVGQAGVPGPTLMVVAVLVAAGIPIEGLPMLYALDRVFDMIRTVLNITGDAACAAVTDRLAGVNE